ncbi:MAG: hypothetical protein NVSMB52_18970 [Chloroflexota bacterium]
MSDSEHFNEIIENLLADRSPKYDAASLDEHELKMLRMAQLLRGNEPPLPDREFVQSLRTQLLPTKKLVSRRTAFTASIGALAAAVLVAIGIKETSRNDGRKSVLPGASLTPERGQWFSIASLSQLAPGSVRPFTAGSVHGYLMNRDGNLSAVSRICTHMQCTLKFELAKQGLVCPCHGAEFDLKGNNIAGPGRYSGDLPTLPTLRVRVSGDSVEVLGA